MLGCEEIAADWSVNREVGEEEDWDEDHWRPAWIPFTSDGGGNAMCVDASSGRVIFWEPDAFERDVQAPSLEGWLTRWADELEAGEQVADEEDGAIVEAWLVDT